MADQVKKGIISLVLSVLLFAAVHPAQAAADGMAILKKDCASCHNLTGLAPQTVKALWSRKGPDLFYAGNKYKKEWLESWLQKPDRIRPAGIFYADNIKKGEKQDVVDESKLKPHVALPLAEAKGVAEALMTLKDNEKLIKKGDFVGDPAGVSMGEMVFDKFLGCLPCHRIESDYGGLSGPELYTAGKRLQEDFMVSYIRNPQAWDPKTFMPNKHVSETNLQKLVTYLKSLSEE